MSESSPSLLLLDEPVLEAPTTPTPPPQPGEHNMRRRSQGIEPPCSLLDAHLRKHIHTHLEDEKFPTVATPVQTPRRILHGAATSSSDDSIGTRSNNMLVALAPTDGMAATHSPEDTPRPLRPMARPRQVPLVNASCPMTTLRIFLISSLASPRSQARMPGTNAPLC